MILTENLDAFQNFFQAHHDMNKIHQTLNKATNAIIGKKFYSKETKKTWQVINTYERGSGSLLSKYFEVLIEDISTDLHPQMMVPVELLEEKIKNGSLKVIEYEWEDKK